MALRRTALKSVLWSALENGSTAVISFLSLIVFAMLLEPSDFGVFAICVAVIEIAGIFTNMVFHDALVQSDRASDCHFNSAFTFSIALGLIVYWILWVAFPSLASLVEDPRIGDVGRVLALGLLVTGPAGVMAARQSRQFGFRVLATRTLAGRLGGAILGILSAFIGFGLWSLVVQHLAMMVLGAVTLLIYSASHVRLTTDLRPIRDLLSYSVFSVTSLAAGFVTKRVFMFAVGFFLGTEKAGYLNLAFRLVDTLWAISATALAQVLLPTLSRLQGNRPQLLDASRVCVRVASAILYPTFAGLGVLAPEVIELLFGRKWSSAAQMVLVLGLLTYVQVPRLVAVTLLNSISQVKIVSSVNLAVLGYLGAAIVITRVPSEYAALAIWAAGEITAFVLFSFVLRVRIGISFSQQLADIAAPVAASVSMIIAIAVVRTLLPVGLAVQWRMLELGLVGALTYTTLMLLFGRHLIAPAVEMARVLLRRN